MGNADRAAFDLSAHTKATGVKLAAEKKLPEPKKVELEPSRIYIIQNIRNIPALTFLMDS